MTLDGILRAEGVREGSAGDADAARADDPYSVLGVARDTSPEEIQRAYEALGKA